MIEFENVTVTEQRKKILQNISFTIEKNEKAVIHGKSGSGKSTIIRTLLGGHRILEGNVRFEGCMLSRHSIREIRTRVAFIGQEPFLGQGTVEEVLLLPFTFRVNIAQRPDRPALCRVLERVGLSDSVLRCDAATVSGGEKQRIAVARALLMKKSVFCIDEATSALDSVSAETISSLFRNEDFTILSVSHDPRWLSIAGRFIQIDSGEIVADTTDRQAVKI